MVRHVLSWGLTVAVVIGCWVLLYWPIRPTYRDREKYRWDD